MGSDSEPSRKACLTSNFNPRSPHGERQLYFRCFFGWILHFNPRSPHGERQEYEAFDAMYAVFQSTLPAWGATGVYCYTHAQTTISIHAPRMGSDQWEDTKSALHFLISIHAPRMGSDVAANNAFNDLSAFQSTLPAWGATAQLLKVTLPIVYFNPRSPHGERRGSLFTPFE